MERKLLNNWVFTPSQSANRSALPWRARLKTEHNLLGLHSWDIVGQINKYQPSQTQAGGRLRTRDKRHRASASPALWTLVLVNLNIQLRDLWGSAGPSANTGWKRPPRPLMVCFRFFSLSFCSFYPFFSLFLRQDFKASLEFTNKRTSIFNVFEFYYLYFILCACVFSYHMYSLAPVRQEEDIRPLELKLQMAVSDHVGPVTPGPPEKRPVLLTLSHLCSPDLELFIFTPSPFKHRHFRNTMFGTCSFGDETQGFVYTRETLYQLKYTPVPPPSLLPFLVTGSHYTAQASSWPSACLPSARRYKPS